MSSEWFPADFRSEEKETNKCRGFERAGVFSFFVSWVLILKVNLIFFFTFVLTHVADFLLTRVTPTQGFFFGPATVL